MSASFGSFTFMIQAKGYNNTPERNSVHLPGLTARITLVLRWCLTGSQEIQFSSHRQNTSGGYRVFQVGRLCKAETIRRAEKSAGRIPVRLWSRLKIAID
jgi:hypothetical protein